MRALYPWKGASGQARKTCLLEDLGRGPVAGPPGSHLCILCFVHRVGTPGQKTALHPPPHSGSISAGWQRYQAGLHPQEVREPQGSQDCRRSRGPHPLPPSSDVGLAREALPL